MEKIIIKNFLIFDDVEMPIRRLNVLIGEQASGKSLLAKLVYFFKEIYQKLIQSIFLENDIDEFKQSLSTDFKTMFALSENNSQKFKINYFYSDLLFVEIFETSKNQIEIIFSQSIIDFYYQSKKKIENTSTLNLNLAQQIEKLIIQQEVLRFFNIINNRKRKQWVINSFVPASRSFYAILENNSFSLLADNQLKIDTLIKNFGTEIQSLKNNFSNKNLQIEQYFSKILKGKYQRINGDDWIIGENFKITLDKASSGQQEFFPLMLIMNATLDENTIEIKNLFIEEPEAHLFPQAQNSVVSAILYIMNQTSTNFFITTHSPYILTALNNSIFAQELIKKDKLTLEKYVAMSDGAYPIDFDDISAYSLDNGKIINIKDLEYKMLGGEILDQVSNDFGKIFNELLELDN